MLITLPPPWPKAASVDNDVSGGIVEISTGSRWREPAREPG